MNEKINWKQKLTSRKFWMAIIGFVSSLLIAFGVAQETATQVTGIIMAGATCISYIIGEGLVDHARNAEQKEDVPLGFDDFVESEIDTSEEE